VRLGEPSPNPPQTLPDHACKSTPLKSVQQMACRQGYAALSTDTVHTVHAVTSVRSDRKMEKKDRVNTINAVLRSGNLCIVLSVFVGPSQCRGKRPPFLPAAGGLGEASSLLLDHEGPLNPQNRGKISCDVVKAKINLVFAGTTRCPSAPKDVTQASH